MELTQEQSMMMDFIGEQANIITRDGNSQRWRENIIKNRQFFSQGNPDVTGLTAFVVCAGPSLDKNVEDLKLMSERGVIVCLDAALRFLLKRGVRPEYCMLIDGSDKMKAMVEGCDTTGITLVCTPSACPDVVAEWKGPRFFVTTPYLDGDKTHNYHHLTRIVKAKKDLKTGDCLFLDDDYEVEFGGVTEVIMCGGNVSTAAHHFAMQFLKAQQIVFVGADLSWKYESHHYAGHEHEENTKDRTGIVGHSAGGTHKDINGDEVNTNLSLLAFKRWHEAMARQMKGSVINATEGGILGIDQKGEHVDYIEFLTLREAISKYTPKR
jgi:hypothetical protein